MALEDGTIVEGRSFGAQTMKPVTGEVVFNTAMCGYQEAMTDPSYLGQILIMTAPEIGNYGVNQEDVESHSPKINGLVVKELSRKVSNYRSDNDLSNWLTNSNVPAMDGVDTRALVRRIRACGALRGVMTTDTSLSNEDLVSIALSSPLMVGQDLATAASCDEVSPWSMGLEEWNTYPEQRGSKRWKVVSLDCGAKHNIYRHLESVGCDVISLPNKATPDEIRSHNPDGLFISNGPGDPDAVTTTVETLKEISGEIPTFGICLGHQMLSLALGAKTWKLPFGHHGANHPVRDLDTGEIEITSQNHGFCVDEESLIEAGCIITHRHLNDGTVAGFRHASRPIMGVQFHPEASPGPHDSSYLFLRFVQLMKSASLTK